MVSSLSWNPDWYRGYLVISAQEGLNVNRFWEKRIEYNRRSPRDPLLYKPPEFFVTGLKKVFLKLWMSEGSAESKTNFVAASLQHAALPLMTSDQIATVFSGITTTLLDAQQYDYIDEIENYWKACLIGTCTLMALNSIALLKQVTHKNLSDDGSYFDKLLIIVCQATPYLLIITNIALLYIEIHYNPVGASLKLMVTGITFFDLSSWKPASFGWYLDVGIAIPLDLAAMYYDPSSFIKRGINFITSGKLMILWNLFKTYTVPQPTYTNYDK